MAGFLGVCFEAVDEFVDAFHFECRAEEAGEEFTVFDHGLDGGDAYLFGFEVFVHGVFRLHGDFFHHTGERWGVGGFVGRGGEVDAGVVESVFELAEDVCFVGAGGVHFVDEEDGGYVVACEESPEGLGVALDAVGAGDDEDGVVEDA